MIRVYNDELAEKINDSLALANRSNFYKNKRIAQKITNIHEFSSISPTRKEELRASNPFDLLSTSINNIQEYHETFGTTGKQVSVWYTKEDMEMSNVYFKRSGLDIKKSDIAMIRLPYAVSLAAHVYANALMSAGATVIPVSRGSAVTPYRRVVEMLRRLKVTILLCNPSEAILLADVIKRIGYDVKKDFSLRAICVGGEMLHEKRKAYIESIYGIPVYNYYGSTETSELAVSCEYGHLHLMDEYYFEVIDMETGIPVKGDGKGILYITQLKKKAFPLIRYNTEDIVEIKKSTCECGKEKDILKHHGRIADRIIIGNESCTMYEFQDALYKCKNINEIKHWRVKILDDRAIIYIEGDISINNQEISLTLPFKNKVVMVENGKIQDVDKLLEMTELKKQNYFL